MANDKSSGIHFGALVPPLSEQLEGVLPKKDLKRFDAMAQAIVICNINGLISDGDAHKARQRLVKKLEALQKQLLQPKRKVPA